MRGFGIFVIGAFVGAALVYYCEEILAYTGVWQGESAVLVASAENSEPVVRVVTHVRDTTRITHICNPDEDWSPRAVEDAIIDINERDIQYVVMAQVSVNPKPENSPTFLTTEPTNITVDNLGSLDRCDQLGSALPSDENE